VNNSQKIWQTRAIDNLEHIELSRLCTFFNDTFGAELLLKFTPNFFLWKLGPNNPSGQGFLTVALSNDRVVGCASATSAILDSKFGAFRGIEIGDTFTHPVFRVEGKPEHTIANIKSLNGYLNKSIFGRLVTETLSRAKAEGLEFVYGTPNHLSLKPYIEKLSFKQIDQGKIISIAKPSYKVFNLPSKTRSKFSDISKKSATALILFDWFTSLWSQFSCRKFELRFVDGTTLINSDVIWNKISRIESFTKFSKNYFEFRFLKNPVKEYRFLEVVNQRNGQLLGLVIFRIEKSRIQSLVKVVKWFLFDKSAELKLLHIVRVALLQLDDCRCTIWINKDISSPLKRISTGFWSTSFKVPIIAKELTDKKIITSLRIDLFSMSDCDIG